MTTSKEIRAKLKTVGYNSRQISVKERQGGMSWSFTCTVRDESVDVEKAKEAVSDLVSIDRCERSGEILGGGNTYIFFRDPDGRSL